ncbi:short chain dehydrogenase/reductase family protein [Aspergillus tanneri]|uniref:Uncharacterized protein n=1 Tax=Aspergillus tanneri TaxID=1220188 RepID=A0A5M9MYW6_9EURO|nr:uncharacterized protein ATNIH1004_001235 [Aspergillus tanneri]KAA8652331.1 hypothetical protein ATNIH1004_001235 [Aspergillus tanneri]
MNELRLMEASSINRCVTGFTADVFAYCTAKGKQTTQRYPRTFQWLQILASLAILRRTNSWANRRALDNGTSDCYDWTREVVVLTGGSNGIGKQIAILLGNRGIKVAVLDIQPPQDELPPTVRYCKCDITYPAEVSEVAANIPQTRLQFEVNTLSHYWLSREYLPSMIQRNHGMVVTVASQAGYVTTPNMVDYSATKAAAISFHEGLGAELVSRYNAPRVRTVLVTQGFTQTALISELTPEDTWFNPLLLPETVAEAIVKQVLTGSSGHVLVPGSTGWLAKIFRGFPLWYQHKLRVRLERLMRAS